MVETPVLFITFARPEYARQTWEGIKSAQPKTLYFYSNKGRVDKNGELERNNEIRAYINEIDWECDLHTFFREECVNVYDSLRGAIDWLFDNEEQGIILEEDCVPTNAFFSFCDQMLEKFKDDWRVWCVSGDNIIKENPSGYDYFFSHLHAMYGWASWADRWNNIDWDNLYIEETISSGLYYRLFKTREQAKSKEKTLIRRKEFLQKTKCWDYVFGLKMDQYGALTVMPKKHLVKNIGLSGQHAGGTYSQYNTDTNILGDVYCIELEPPFVIADFEHDYLTFSRLLKQPSIFKRALKRLFHKK